MTPDLTTGLMSYIVFVYSTTLHEAAHAWTAWKLGDDTAYRGGQVSLDPIPHIRREPFGMVVVPILSYCAGGWLFGWASAPYDPNWARSHPRHSALMALAGPAANLLLLVCAGLGIRAGMLAGVFDAPDSVSWMRVTAATVGGPWSFLAALLSVIFSLNLLLFAFNLLPLPPLDGSQLPLLLLRGAAADAFMTLVRQPMFAMIGLVVAWKAFGPLYPVIRLFALRLLYPEFHYG